MPNRVPSNRKIYVVDDHPLVRSALIHLIQQTPGLMVIGENDGSGDTLQQLFNSGADLVLLDLNLKGTDGIDLLKKIRAQHPEMKVLIISMHDDPAYVHAAMRGGAAGYLLKTNETDLIPIAIQTVLKDGTFLSSQVSATLQAGESQRDILTTREIEVIRGVTHGLGAKEIAERLGISHRTVEVHRTNAMRKLNAKNSAELARIGIERGFSQPLEISTKG